MFLPGERLVAERATVRRLARVLPHVVREVLLPRERLVAIGAFVWRLASVLSDVVHCG